MKRAGICVVICLIAGPACSHASGADQFDLACHGGLVEFLPETTQSFATVMRVDLATRRFCLDDCRFVFHLTGADAARLVYHYDVAVADADHAAGRYRADANQSSAGPYPQKDDIVIDRATGAFHRTFIFDAGDPAARRRQQEYAGACTIAPFGGFPQPGR